MTTTNTVIIHHVFFFCCIYHKKIRNYQKKLEITTKKLEKLHFDFTPRASVVLQATPFARVARVWLERPGFLLPRFMRTTISQGCMVLVSL